MPVIPLKLLSYDDAQDLMRLVDALNYNFRYLDWLINHGNLDATNVKGILPSTAEYRIQPITDQIMQINFTQYYAVEPAVLVCVNGIQTNVLFSFIREATPKGEFITGMNITFPDTSYVGKSANILILGEGVAEKE